MSFSSDPCNLTGKDAVVLFTSFAGTDPHALLLHTAVLSNFTVFFGLPRVPVAISDTSESILLPAYYEFVERVLNEHKIRYSVPQIKRKEDANNSKEIVVTSKTLYDVVGGYYVSDSCNLGTVEDDSNPYIKLYSNLSSLVMKIKANKKLAVAPYTDLNKYGHNKTIGEHERGFKYLARTGVDIIAVHEGRGYGNAPYYWPTESRSLNSTSDPTLEKILKENVNDYRGNGTFRDVFTGSVNEVIKI